MLTLFFVYYLVIIEVRDLLGVDVLGELPGEVLFMLTKK